MCNIFKHHLNMAIEKKIEWQVFHYVSLYGFWDKLYK